MDNAFFKSGSILVDLNAVRLVTSGGLIVFSDGSEQRVPQEDVKILIDRYSDVESPKSDLDSVDVSKLAAPGCLYIDTTGPGLPLADYLEGLGVNITRINRVEARALRKAQSDG